MEVLKNVALLHFNVTSLCSSCLEFHWGSCSVSILCLLGLCVQIPKSVGCAVPSVWHVAFS